MIEKLFRLTWKKGCIIALSFMVMLAAHNFVSVLYKADNACDTITFIIALYVIPAYLIICIIYSAIKRR